MASRKRTRKPKDVWTLRWRRAGSSGKWTNLNFDSGLEFAKAYYRLWNGRGEFKGLGSLDYDWRRNGKRCTDDDIEIHSEGVDDLGGKTMYCCIDGGPPQHVGWP